MIPENTDSSSDPDPRMVDVVLAVVGPDQLLVVMHPEGYHQVDHLKPGIIKAYGNPEEPYQYISKYQGSLEFFLQLFNSFPASSIFWCLKVVH